MTVYFIVAPGIPTPRVKIGYARDYEHALGRLRSFQTGHYERLILLAAHDWPRATERELHTKFRHLRIPNAGREWFLLTDEIISTAMGPSLPDQSFHTWARSLQTFDDPRGDFLTDFHEDKKFPADASCYNHGSSYLRTRNACNEAIDEYSALWRLYVSVVLPKMPSGLALISCPSYIKMLSKYASVPRRTRVASE